MSFHNDVRTIIICYDVWIKNSLSTIDSRDRFEYGSNVIILYIVINWAFNTTCFHSIYPAISLWVNRDCTGVKREVISLLLLLSIVVS